MPTNFPLASDLDAKSRAAGGDSLIAPQSARGMVQVAI